MKKKKQVYDKKYSMCFNGKIKHATEDNAKKKKLQIQIPENVMEKCVIEFSSDFSCMRHEHCVEDKRGRKFLCAFCLGIIRYLRLLSIFILSYSLCNIKKPMLSAFLSYSPQILAFSSLKLLQEQKDLFLDHFQIFPLTLKCYNAYLLVHYIIFMNKHQKRILFSACSFFCVQPRVCI